MTIYRVFGLTLASELALPELPQTNGPADVTIRWGQTPAHLDAPTICRRPYEIRGDHWLIDGGGNLPVRFLVVGGHEVIAEQTGPVDESALRLWLLGSCMGALLLQRGALPLHGNAVAGPRGAAIFTGAVGAGKSTLSLALLQRGHRLLSDDISAVRLDRAGAPQVAAGFPRVKLWAEACALLGVATDTLERIRPELQKYHFPLDGAFVPHPLPLDTVYVLLPGPWDAPAMEELHGAAKVRALQAHLYKVLFAEGLSVWPWLFAQSSAVAAHTRLCLIQRPTDPVHLHKLVDLIEKDMVGGGTVQELSEQHTFREF